MRFSGFVLAIFFLSVFFPLFASAASESEMLFYNARVAARERRFNDVIRIWLLNSAWESEGHKNIFDRDLRSVVWVAIGQNGICPDQFRADEKGAGLWPVAVANYLIHSLRPRHLAPDANAFDGFEKHTQIRSVSFNDILSMTELNTLRFRERECDAFRVFDDSNLEERKENRLDLAKKVRDNLIRAKQTIDTKKVPSSATLEARIFDLDLFIGASDKSATSPDVELLFKKTLGWKTSDWLALSSDRRASLFGRIEKFYSPKQKQDLVFSILDGLISRKSGVEIKDWIAFLDIEKDENAKKELSWGTRGENLLLLSEENGFGERSLLAWYRGIEFLKQNNLREALRSFGFAIRYADESAEPDSIKLGVRRWIAFVAGSYTVSTELIETLKEILPPEDFQVVAQDLAWRAVLRFDGKSYGKIMTYFRKQSAAQERFLLLKKMAFGDLGGFEKEFRQHFTTEPSRVSKVLKLYLDELEREDVTIRARHISLMRSLQHFLIGFKQVKETKKEHVSKNIQSLISQLDSGLRGMNVVTESGGTRDLNPHSSVFVGSVRVPPTDAIPWPFHKSDHPPPSVFSLIGMLPEEWRENGEPVYGWKLTE